MAKKFLDSEGVKVLWQEICSIFTPKEETENFASQYALFKEDVDYQLGDLYRAINALQAQAAGESDRTAAAIANVVDNAPDAFDTLKEIADYIAGDETRAGDILSRLSSVEDSEAIGLTKDEIKDIAQRTYEETILHKYRSNSVADVANALANIEEDGEIVLEGNVDLGTTTLTIPKGKAITLNLGGNELDIATTGNTSGLQVLGNLTVTNGAIHSAKRAMAVFNGGSLTIGEGAEVVAGDVAISAQGAGSEIIMEDGSVTAQESGLLVTSGAKLTMNGGIVTGLDNGPIMGNGTKGQGDVEIVMNGGELVANIESNGYVAVGVYMPNSGSFTMNGGKITANGGAGVVCRGGVTTLNGGEIITTAHPTLEVGKVGDSRVVVPCSAVVYDKNSKYPAMDTLQIVIGKDMILNGAHEDISIISDEETPNIVDNREEVQVLPGE